MSDKNPKYLRGDKVVLLVDEQVSDDLLLTAGTVLKVVDFNLPRMWTDYQFDYELETLSGRRIPAFLENELEFESIYNSPLEKALR